MEEQPADRPSRADSALDRVVALQAQIDALTAERTRALRAFERAYSDEYPASAAPFRERSMRAELACAIRVPERTAERMLGEARVLVDHLPATLSRLAEGAFGYRHAQVLVDELSGLDADDRAVVERLALASAPTQTASRFARTVRRLRERRDPSSMAERCREAFADRSVTVEPGRDGVAFLTATLGVVDAIAILDRLTGAAVRHRAAGDPRTLAQLRSDLLADALLGRDVGSLGLPDVDPRGGDRGRDITLGDPVELLRVREEREGVFRGIVPTVIVTVPVQTLLGGDEPATLEGAGPIDAVTARRLTAEAPSLFRLLTHPETGVALSLGRTSYVVPEALRRWLRIRDGSCRFPMCGIGTGHCDLDHTHDWARGGPTDHDNLAHLSRGHHTLKHHGGWQVDQPHPGVLEWTSPLGRRYTTAPEVG